MKGPKGDPMDMDERPRGRHFASKPTVRSEAPRPDETTAFLAAARTRFEGDGMPMRRPDETSVYLSAAERSRLEAALAPVPVQPMGEMDNVGDLFPVDSELVAEEGSDFATGELFSDAGVTGALGGDHAALVSHATPSHAAVRAHATARGDAALESEPVESTGVIPAMDEDFESEEEVEQIASQKANTASILVIISRITGFGRTMAQANALSGALMAVASCYTVASTMPNFLYELVMGGMLITSFLPVYVSVRKRLGRQGAADYASNLLSLVVMLMGVMSVVSFIFAAPLIWTQSAGASSDFNFDLAVWFFRFFAFEIVLYGLSSIISGVLNAERDYFWSNAAPIVNNVITIASFSLYAYVVKSGILTWEQALIILAVGNPLGVAAQVFMQIPALARHGVRLRFRVDLHDPAIKETLAIGLPTLVVTFASFPTSAVQSSCALQVTANGAAIAYYSRVWYVLPYSILAIPISVTMFTELSNFRVAGRMDAYKRALVSGMRKLMFTLIPCSLLLIVFAPVLIAVIGGFDAEDAALTAAYLQVQAVALPFYALSTYLQKVCSSLMRMKFYAIATCVAAVVQVTFCIVLTPVYGLYVVPFSSTFFFIAVDVVTILNVRREIGSLGLSSVVSSCVRGLVFGLLGAATGAGILLALNMFAGEVGGSMMRGLIYACAAGIPSLIMCYGLSYAMHKSEAPFFDAIFGKVGRLVRRA